MSRHLSPLLACAAALAFMSSAQSVSALTIVLTNDDGFDAPGIQALKTALSEEHTVILVAPIDQQSGSSAALNLESPAVLVTKVAESGDDLEFAVSTFESGGTEGAEPASCALVGLSIAPRADLLISGINSGANIGSLTQISGTVGAATMGLNGTLNQQLASIAVSTEEICDPDELDEPSEEDLAECQDVNEAHYARVASFVEGLVALLESKPGFLNSEEGLLPTGTGLNINYPPTEVPKGVVVAAQGQLATLGGSPFPLQLLYGCFGDCAGAAVGETVAGGITGIAPDLRDDVKNSDSSLFAEGFITLVPFQVDYTAKSYLQFKSILKGLSY